MQDFQTIEWLDMRLAAPADWEIVRHSVKPAKGRLVLVDRRHQRLQLSWAAVASAPDLGQTVKDYRARGQKESPESRFEDFRGPGRWVGLRQINPTSARTLAGLYERAQGRWVEMVIHWPRSVERDVEQQILRRFELADRRAWTARWRAFQIDVELPRDWSIAKADVKPADARLEFASGRNRAEVRRTGMPDAWFDGNLENVVRLRLGTAPCQASARTCNGHPALLADSRDRAAWLRSVLTGNRRRRELVWLCPGSHAVFEVTTHAGPRAAVEPDQFRVRCCPAGGAAR